MPRIWRTREQQRRDIRDALRAEFGTLEEFQAALDRLGAGISPLTSSAWWRSDDERGSAPASHFLHWLMAASGRVNALVLEQRDLVLAGEGLRDA